MGNAEYMGSWGSPGGWKVNSALAEDTLPPSSLSQHQQTLLLATQLLSQTLKTYWQEKKSST